MPGHRTPLHLFGRTLLVVAAPAEARAVSLAFGVSSRSGATSETRWDWQIRPLCSGFDLLESGVGKVNAAAATACALAAGRYEAVLNVGVCGSLPAARPAEVGAVILASASLYADEGIATEEGFKSLPEMGFPLGPFEGAGVVATESLRAALEPFADVVGPIATVSTCSGTDELARQVVARTDAIAEAMEGAAVGQVLSRLAPGCAFAELRVVSNTTGSRSKQRWDLQGALARLTSLIGSVTATPPDSRT